MIFTLLAVHSAFLQAEAIHSHEEGNNTAIKIKSVRGVLGTNNPITHTRAQIRAGYITLKEDNSPRSNAYALGGHVHFDTKRWYGIELGVSAYTVLNLANTQNPSPLHEDFFEHGLYLFIWVIYIFSTSIFSASSLRNAMSVEPTSISIVCLAREQPFTSTSSPRMTPKELSLSLRAFLACILIISALSPFVSSVSFIYHPPVIISVTL